MAAASSAPSTKALPPLRVTITGAAGQIAYSLVFMIARGGVFGDRLIDLRLLDIPPAESVLRAVGMELEDVSSPVVLKHTCTLDPKEAFLDCDIAILVGAKPRGPGMLRKDLLKANAAIFKEQGKVIDSVASRDVKVVVVGNPANTNALLVINHAPSIPPENVTALSRLDQNRAVGLVAAKAGLPATQIRNVAVWGNHSATQFPMAQFATVEHDGVVESVPALIGPDASRWFREDLVPAVQQRGKAVIDARGSSSAASAASAVCDHLRDWTQGSGGNVVSMGVASNGNPFGVADGLVFSFPVVTEPGGKWRFADGFHIDEDSRERLLATQSELEDEREAALAS